jgi:hypothetical protein
MNHLLIIIILSALASIAVTRVYALPASFYRMAIFKRKPLSCMTCLAFWIGLVIAIPISPYLCIVVGLASSGAAVAIANTCKL